jgi:hypothetical protein
VFIEENIVDIPLLVYRLLSSIVAILVVLQEHPEKYLNDPFHQIIFHSQISIKTSGLATAVTLTAPRSRQDLEALNVSMFSSQHAQSSRLLSMDISRGYS